MTAPWTPRAWTDSNAHDSDPTYFTADDALGIGRALLAMRGAGVANVCDYGAVGDGETNSSASVQAAIDSGAAVVYFPFGDYLCGTPDMSEHCPSFVGAGREKTFLTGTFNFVRGQINGADPHIRGINFRDSTIVYGDLDGGPAMPPAAHNYANDILDTFISDCYFFGTDLVAYRAGELHFGNNVFDMGTLTMHECWNWRIVSNCVMPNQSTGGCTFHVVGGSNHMLEANTCMSVNGTASSYEEFEGQLSPQDSGNPAFLLEGVSDTSIVNNVIGAASIGAQLVNCANIDFSHNLITKTWEQGLKLDTVSKLIACQNRFVTTGLGNEGEYESAVDERTFASWISGSCDHGIITHNIFEGSTNRTTAVSVSGTGNVITPNVLIGLT